MTLDILWLRERGYILVGDRAVKIAPEAPGSLQEPRMAPDESTEDGEPERALMARILRLAVTLGWTSYHTYRSDRSPKGFPDLVLVRPGPGGTTGRLLFVEVKSARGKLTPEQVTWFSLLRHSVPGIETYIWRPKDWSRIEQLLNTGPASTPGLPTREE